MIDWLVNELGLWLGVILLFMIVFPFFVPLTLRQFANKRSDEKFESKEIDIAIREREHLKKRIEETGEDPTPQFKSRRLRKKYK